MTLDAGGAVLGYASVLLAPARPTVADHDMTAVRRAARGRGIAGALKRAIDFRLGYQPLPDRVILRGPVFGGIMAR